MTTSRVGQIYVHDCTGDIHTLIANLKLSEGVLVKIGPISFNFTSPESVRDFFDGLSNEYAAWHTDTLSEQSSSHDL